jgi:hypothetical protein
LLALIAEGRLDCAPIRPTCPCGAPAITAPVGAECQRCADPSADRIARRYDLKMDDL